MLLALLACDAEKVREIDDVADTAADTDIADTDTDATDDTDDTDATDDTDESDKDTDRGFDTTHDTDTTGPSGDADDDGYIDVASGGDDCDDTSEWIHPGARDYCDTVDQDCDGDPIGFDCGARIEIEAGATPIAETREWSLFLTLVPDLTGDGQSDVVRLLPYVGAAIIPGASDSPVYDDTPEDHWHVITSFGAAIQAGDLDGDGADDLAILGWESPIDVRYGPFAGPNILSDATDDGVSWSNPFVESAVSVSGADLDGDGRDDMLLAEGWTQSDEPEHRFELYFGGEPRTDCPVSSLPRHGGVTTVGDIDGDGLPELAWPTGDATAISAGADTRDLCGAQVEDFATITVDSGDLNPGPALGDWNGDGYGEWFVYADGELADDPIVIVYSLADAGDGALTTNEAFGSWLAPSDDFEMGVATPTDLDGDGRAELVFSGDRGFALRGGVLPAWGDPLPERRLTWSGPVCTDDACNGDFNGDGLADLTYVTENERVAGETGWIIEGFEVPWDDDTRW